MALTKADCVAIDSLILTRMQELSGMGEKEAVTRWQGIYTRFIEAWPKK